MMNLNALGFEPGTVYEVAIVGYLHATEATFEGCRWTTRGVEYLFRSTDPNGWSFGLMSEHIHSWRVVWTPIG